MTTPLSAAAPSAAAHHVKIEHSPRTVDAQRRGQPPIVLFDLLVWLTLMRGKVGREQSRVCAGPDQPAMTVFHRCAAGSEAAHGPDGSVTDLSFGRRPDARV